MRGEISRHYQSVLIEVKNIQDHFLNFTTMVPLYSKKGYCQSEIGTGKMLDDGRK
jgi:hypothetical protein